jgi:hypothetical protein
MYNRPEEFGGSLFSLAVSVLTDLIHHEPQSFRQLNEAGLPDAFLAAIKVRGAVGTRRPTRPTGSQQLPTLSHS